MVGPRSMRLFLLAAATEAFVPTAVVVLPSATPGGGSVRDPCSDVAPSARIRSWVSTATSTFRASSSARRLFEAANFDGDIDVAEGEGETQKEKGYTDVTVREAVEWTMGKDSEFTYIDVRSAEEHEKLATARGALCIPAFEIVTPETPAAVEGEEGQDEDQDEGVDDAVFAPEYNFEDLEYTIKPDFVDTMKAQFKLDAKLLIGSKTDRSAKACELLVDAGFTQVYNVESQVFMRTRAPEVWS